jgi:hypothetical protein
LVRRASEPMVLRVGLALSGVAAPLEVEVKRLLLLRRAWSVVDLGNVQNLLLPVQHLEKRRSLSQSDS